MMSLDCVSRLWTGAGAGAEAGAVLIIKQCTMSMTTCACQEHMSGTYVKSTMHHMSRTYAPCSFRSYVVNHMCTDINNNAFDKLWQNGPTMCKTRQDRRRASQTATQADRPTDKDAALLKEGYRDTERERERDKGEKKRKTER